MDKLKIPKVSTQSRPGTVTPMTDEEGKEALFSRSDLAKTPADEILTDQDQVDLKRARDNPKLTAMVRHIDNLIDKTQKVRIELFGMIQTSSELKDQCKLQEQEVAILDQEQKRVGDEMIELKQRVEQLSSEKAIMERKLEELKLENDELEAFLAQNKKEVFLSASFKDT